MHNQDSYIIENLPVLGEQAMQVMYEQYYSKLCLKAIRYVKSQETAEDLVQELFIDIWKRRESFDINSSLSGYLQRSVVNRSLNWIRANKVILEDLDQSDSADRNDGSVIENSMEGDELETHINSVIDSLPEKCRLVFIMSRFDQMSYKEIGSQLDISVKTVENQISKALKILRLELKVFSNI